MSGSPRGRSISLFSPRTAVQNNLNCQVEPLLPYNAETPHYPRGDLSGSRPHNESFDSAFLSMPAFPTSSLSDSALDMLLKGEATLDSSVSTQEPTSDSQSDSQGAMSTLDVPNNTLSRRSSRSSSRNQRIWSGESKWDKGRFACASPCPSIASTTSPSSSSTSSACSVSSTCSVNSTGSSASSCTSSLLSPSPMDRSRRSPPPDSCPPMVVQSTTTSHVLSVTLPRVIQPDMVTVAAKKGDRVDVIADAWHMERDCESNVLFDSCSRSLTHTTQATMSGKYVLRLAMSTCRQSALVSDKMESFPLKSKDVSLGRAVLPGLEWDSDTGISSGPDSAADPLPVLHI